MIRKLLKNNKNKNIFVDPDEIFLDSKNLQNFDRQQFEGRIEKPISKKTVLFLNIFFLCLVGIFMARLSFLQVQNGEAYRKRSENNILDKVTIFNDRGIIYDRNKQELAWNKKSDDLSVPYTRAYMSPGLSHVLGYVSYPAADKAGNYWQEEFEGVDGLEKEYDIKIKGENGSKIIETDARGKINSENVVNLPKRGEDLTTTIDSRVQKQLFSVIKTFAHTSGFSGGAGVIMDVRNGEILAS